MLSITGDGFHPGYRWLTVSKLKFLFFVDHSLCRYATKS